VHVVRAHLLERAGDLEGARAELLEAIRRTTSTPEQRHLQRRLTALTALTGERRPGRRGPR
jgi:hypothetical protein